jgi:hypothetical protein
MTTHTEAPNPSYDALVAMFRPLSPPYPPDRFCHVELDVKVNSDAPWRPVADTKWPNDSDTPVEQLGLWALEACFGVSDPSAQLIEHIHHYQGSGAWVVPVPKWAHKRAQAGECAIVADERGVTPAWRYRIRLLSPVA